MAILPLWGKMLNVEKARADKVYNNEKLSPVVKALGTGIRYSPKEMVVTGFLSDAGLLKVRLEGAWVDAFKTFKGRDIDVTVRTVRDHALASCFIPASLFGG